MNPDPPSEEQFGRELYRRYSGCPFALAVARKILVCASMNAARSGVSSFGVIALFLKE